MYALMMAAEEHLTFLGIPINGPVWEFEGKLRMMGFRSLYGGMYVDATQTQDIFEGTLDGEKVRIGVTFNDDSEIVNSVDVSYTLPTREAASAFYDRLVENLSKEYGEYGEYGEYREFDPETSPLIRETEFSVKRNSETVGLILIWDSIETLGGGDGVLVKYMDFVNYSKQLLSIGG